MLLKYNHNKKIDDDKNNLTNYTTPSPYKVYGYLGYTNNDDCENNLNKKYD